MSVTVIHILSFDTFAHNGCRAAAALSSSLSGAGVFGLRRGGLRLRLERGPTPSRVCVGTSVDHRRPQVLKESRTEGGLAGPSVVCFIPDGGRCRVSVEGQLGRTGSGLLTELGRRSQLAGRCRARCGRSRVDSCRSRPSLLKGVQGRCRASTRAPGPGACRQQYRPRPSGRDSLTAAQRYSGSPHLIPWLGRSAASLCPKTAVCGQGLQACPKPRLTGFRSSPMIRAPFPVTD
ncbi:hypothetical protein IWX58_000573 [Rubrivivax gelatinosus]|nr:hypothetical protein [Rubrivivax gelatinosus]